MTDNFKKNINYNLDNSKNSYRSWAEINLTNLRNNTLYIKKHLCKNINNQQQEEIMAVVKADAYGHGIDEIGRCIEDIVDCFGVANIHEAKTLKNNLSQNSKKRIYILSPCLPDEMSEVVENSWIPLVSSLKEIETLDKIAKKKKSNLNSNDTKYAKINICLMIDTGMGRVGFLPNEFLNSINKIKKFDRINIDSIASHFPSADDDTKFTKKQLQLFYDILDKTAKYNLDYKYIHIANSAAIVNLKIKYNKKINILRPGLMIYGCESITKSNALTNITDKLIPVMSWKSKLVLIKQINKNWGINYGRSFITKKNHTIGIVSIGYGDGYSRHLSNQNASVLIKGTRCRILGRVTMDMIVVDLTELIKSTSLKPEEEVVLIGQQGKKIIYAQELAKKSNTISWEIFTGVTKRVPRIYIKK